MNAKYKNIFIWLIIAAVLVMVFNSFSPRHNRAQSYSYSEFMQAVNDGRVKNVTIQNQDISGTMTDNKSFTTYMPIEDPVLLTELMKQGVSVDGKPPEQRGMLMQILISWFPMLLLIGVWLYFMRQMQGGGGKGGPMSFGRSKARLMGEDQVKVTFKDVAGVHEAKDEVSELVEFLRDPGKFQKLGGRIPTGLLLVGPPGTGKTLLAKAVAGEAKVPFFTISGSDFVEMFVGVGASRVRDMFEQAKKRAPCIIFIDEIDAVGRHRGAGLGGGHDEREQTLNQLLVEMDGFGGNEGVIVVAATNRPDVLDAALLRPGRFDRQVTVPLPDIQGREQILEVHMNKVPSRNDVRASVIARGTPGFSGADLANLVNEAALFAARANKKEVGMLEFEKAKDKLIMGAERRSMVMSDDEKKLTAYHEAGHAIVGLNVPDHDPVYKVSIIPRGRALGVTMFLPESDRYSYSRQRLESQLASLFGGRLAEEIIFGKENVTTGASNDIERATELARNMVTRWGLSEKLGPLTYQEEQGEVFLGRPTSQSNQVSGPIADLIDQEVRRIIDEAYAKAEKILRDHMDVFHLMAEALIKYETIDQSQIKEIMQGKEPTPPEDWDMDDAPKETAEKKEEVVEEEKPAKKVSAKKVKTEDKKDSSSDKEDA